MIDIHSHILPEMDDGPETIEEAIEIARLAAADGTKTIFATPHMAETNEFATATCVSESVKELQKAIDAQGITLNVAPGVEVYPSDDVLRAVDAGLPVKLASSNYLLLDCPLNIIPMGFEQLVFSLQTRGITPILAHPERSVVIQEKPQILEPLVSRGMLVQCNASSILGIHGRQAEETMMLFLQHKWVHFVASDAHSAGRRRPRLSEAVDTLLNLVGSEMTQELAWHNGQRILNGEKVPSQPLAYSPKTRRNWLHKLIASRRGKYSENKLESNVCS